jgi:hypothetical protein
VNVRDPVLEWRTADIAWIAQNQKLLDVVYQWFLREGDWPSVSVLRRHLARQDMTGIDVQAVADAKLLIPGQLTPARREHIALGVRHLIGRAEAAPLLNLGAWDRIGREANNYAKSSFHVPFSHFRWMESQTSV